MMGMLEVGSQFTGVAETMVASEGSIPNSGWSYAQMLADVANDQSSSSSADIACQFVEKYIKQQNRHAIGSVSVDIAAWDLGLPKIKAIDTAFEAFAAAMIDCFKGKGECYGQLKLALLSARFNCQSYTMEQNVDLVDLCELLIVEIKRIEEESSNKDLGSLTTVATRAEAVIRAVKDCILVSGFSGGKNQFSNGISIYFPWTKDSYCASLSDYLRLKFVDRSTKKEKVYSNWKTFLEFYLSEVTFRRPPVVGVYESSIIFESFTVRTVLPGATSRTPQEIRLTAAPAIGIRHTIPTTGIRHTILTTGIRHTIPTTVIRHTIPTTGIRRTIPTTVIRHTIPTTGIRRTVGPVIADSVISSEE
jgi:Clostripain family